MPYHSKKFRQNPFTTFSVIRRTDRQTDRRTDRLENITSFGGGDDEDADDDELCSPAPTVINSNERANDTL